VYGDPPTLPVAEDTPTDPLSPYAASKLAAEEQCRRFAAAGGLETVCLRYFNVYGPRQDPSSEYSGVIARFMDGALAGRPLTIFGDGDQTRDFVFVGDVVRANVSALTGGSPAFPGDGRPVNVGSGVPTSVSQIAAAVRLLAGRDVAVRSQLARAGDILHSQADTALAASLLGFRAETSFADGLAETFAWFAGL
jgi:UDP-glucose 4-epimerase